LLRIATEVARKGQSAMGIDGVSSTRSVSPLDPLLQMQGQRGVISPGSDADAGSSISGFANALKELQQLQQSDPAKFKEVTADIAKTLEADARSATGPQSQFLSELASRFEEASQSGSMSSLEPSRSISGHHGHRHHQHSGVKSYAAQQPDSSAGSQQSQVDLSQIIQDALQSVGDGG
jgi:hypothetical protein